MAICISKRLTALPGVHAELHIDSSQLTKRQRNSVIKQLRTGVLMKSGTGDLVWNIFKACYPHKNIPVHRRWASLVIRNEYIDSEEVIGVLDAVVTTAHLMPNKRPRGYSSGDVFRVDHDASNDKYYRGFTELRGCRMLHGMLDMSVSEKWKKLADSVIARVEAGDKFVYKITD